MSNWTDADERQLQEMLARKEAHQSEQSAALYEIVNRFFYRACSVGDVVDGLVENRLDLIRVLAEWKG